MLRVQITNQSVLMLGSGSGRGSYIDSDIIFDDYGLPIFPGKRFKGLLRESALEVLEMFQQGGMGAIFSADIEKLAFGSPTAPAGFRVDNLYLEGHQRIIDSLQFIQREHKQFLSKEAVMNALTDIRQQTAINDEGYARDNSLRVIRVLKAKHCFNGNIEIIDIDNREEIAALLSLACRNLKRAGSGRNRGWGTINCVLLTDKEEDLAYQIIEKIEKWEAGDGRIFWNPSKQVQYDPAVGDELEVLPGAGHKLDYWIKNTAPLLFTAPDGDENMVTSFDHIPGSTLHGFFANQLIRRRNIAAGKAHEDIVFRQLFIGGHLSFSNAYPGSRKDDYRFDPTPLFLHTDKEKHNVYDLSDSSAKSDDTKSIGGYGCIINGGLYRHEPDKNVNFHLVRNSDPDKPEERIEGHVKEGGIYHYESLNPYQDFYGSITGTEAALNLFSRWLMMDGPAEIRLGRSLNTQYGAAKIEFQPIKPDDCSLDDLFSDQRSQNGRRLLASNELLMYMRSPLVLHNEYGFPAADEIVLKTYLQEKMDVPQIRILQSFARVEERKSFAAQWKMPEAAFKCWSSGSSFLLQLLDDSGQAYEINQELFDKQLAAIMQEGIGEKRTLGFGQVRFARAIPIVNGFSEKAAEKDAEVQIDPAVIPILKDIYQDHLLRMVSASAADRAGDFFKKDGMSSNLLGRLERISTESSDKDAFAEKVKQLRKEAADKLKDLGRGNKNLYEELTGMDLKKWCGIKREKQLGTLEKIAVYLNADINADIDSLYKEYWRAFFRTMRKLQKEGRGDVRG